jgi:hypothetical protein
MAAFLGGALLLVTRAIKAHKVYQAIDGSLLILFRRSIRRRRGGRENPVDTGGNRFGAGLSSGQCLRFSPPSRTCG